MRFEGGSKPRKMLMAWSLLLPTATFDCAGEDTRIGDVCRSLKECAGYIGEKMCETDLKDAVNDGRVTPAELTRCSRCLVDNNSQPNDDRLNDATGNCALLGARDCDRACENLGLVLGARTSRSARDEACKSVSSACRVDNCLTGIGGPGDTIAEMEANDAVVEACIRCIAEVPVPVPENVGTGGEGAGGAALAGSVDGGEERNADIAIRCDQMIEKCSSPCLGVSAIDTRLTLAQSARVYCNKQRSCDGSGGAADQPPTDATAGSGGGGAGGSVSQGCLPQPFLTECVTEFLCEERRNAAKLADEKNNPHSCLTCLATSDCSALCDGQCKASAGN